MGKQGILSYRTEGEQTRDNLTGLSGLAPYVDLVVASGVLKSLGDWVSICGDQGWTDEEMGLSLLLLNLAESEESKHCVRERGLQVAEWLSR